jgi:sugar phosphate isomerase/epimerase
LWLILGGRGEKVEVKREEIVAFLRTMAEKGKAAGVEVVIYPEWVGPGKVSFIKTAEDALSYIKEVGSDNLFVSLHLCHELKAGNGDRLEEIAAKIKPWLRLATINGADEDAADELDGWTRTIQPLGMGTYDSSKLLKALQSIGYKGPVILHTGGGLGRRAPRDHHQTSFKRFQEMVNVLDED